MKVILLIITVMTLVIGASINSMASDAGRTDICRNVLHNGFIVVLYICPVV